MKTGYHVIDAMTRKPIMVEATANLEECAKIMADHSIGSLLVGTQEKLEGILSSQDIVRRVVALGKNPLQMNVSEAMATNIITITPEKDIYEALLIMKEKDVRHLPVVDNSKLLGLITMKDILKIQPQLFDLIVEKFILREETAKPIKAKFEELELDDENSEEFADKVFDSVDVE